MRIADFTVIELDRLKSQCNFTDSERKCFELKAKDCTNTQIALDLNVSESTVAVIMRRVRMKITKEIERSKTAKLEYKPPCESCPCFPEVHTVKEWAELDDKISVLYKWYVYSDYRTDNYINVPRFKFGDGKTPVSELPFVTAAITDNDVELWDEQIIKE